MVACALGGATKASCRPVAISDLVRAVTHALYGCDVVWLSKPVCQQCEPCDASVGGLVGGASNSFVSDLRAAGIAIVDSSIELVGVACAACGCPEFAILHVLVPSADVDALLALGWTRQP